MHILLHPPCRPVFCWLALIVVFNLMAPAHVSGDVLDLAFPQFYLDIEQQYLDALEENPNSDVYYPATLTYQDMQLSCEVRYRGATSRRYPKKSWKVKFPDNNNIFRQEELNFNAHYVDTTLVRDYLANTLFTYLGYPAPKVSFINVFINNIHAGVFVQTEQVDEFFLDRHDRDESDLFKVLNHAGSMAPLAHDDLYPVVYDRKLGTSNSYLKLKRFLSNAKYWSDDDFASLIEDEIDVDGFLRYVAIAFAISSMDNFTKNYYLYSNPETGKFEVFPWDNDATFGNSWEGDYLESLETFMTGSLLDNHTVFRRLMEIESYRDQFWAHVTKAVTEGFPYLETVIDSVATDVRHDIYAESSEYPEAFDEALADLRRFLTNRALFLQNATLFAPPHLYDFSCSNPVPDQEHTEIVFNVTAASPHPTYVIWSDNVDFATIGSSYARHTLRMFDDGNHHDGEAGDLVYGNTVTLPDEYTGIIPYTFESGGYAFPENGLRYINIYRTHTMALNHMNNDSAQLNNLVFGDAYRFDGDYFIEITNTGSVQLDLSYFYIRSDRYHQITLIPENTVIQPGKTMIAATDVERAAILFEDTPVLENTIFDLTPGCQVALLKPDLSVLTETTCEQFGSLHPKSADIVINEINYNSADSFETGDWIELYNPELAPVDLSGWWLSDRNDNHRFVFPLDTVLHPGKYLVAVCDREAFSTFFPTVETVPGALDFGLSGSGEEVRLFHANGMLIDSVCYDDDEPWPESPDGEGSTLSLKNPLYDNSLCHSWGASECNGTPGRINDIYVHVSETPNFIVVGENYPNPFNATTVIPFTTANISNVRIDVYNIAGQCVTTLFDRMVSPGAYTVQFDGTHYSSGLYFFTVDMGTFRHTGKMMLIR